MSFSSNCKGASALSQPDLLPDEEKLLSTYRAARAAGYSSLEVIIRADVHDSVLVQINTTTKERPIEAGKIRAREVRNVPV